MNRLIIYTLVASLLVPTSSFAERTPTNSPERLQLKNVQLSANGTLIGQYLSQEGLPVSNAKITLDLAGQKHVLSTDERGRFSASGLRGGRCLIRTGTEVFACRLWADGTAPPSSISSVAIVASEGSTVRGNSNWPRQQIPAKRLLAGLTPAQLTLLGFAIAGAAIGISEAADNDGAPAS